MVKLPTPHIEATLGEIEKTVIMPGDPLRAKFIADNFLENVKCFNTVRNILGFTGTYNGKAVSVMASGMGMPSMGIYSYELFNFYNVENIIRIGTAGALHDGIKLMDLVLASGACTDSNYAQQFGLNGSFAPIASFNLLQKAFQIASENKLNVKVGNVLSTDVFYHDNQQAMLSWRKMGVLAVEMEAAALYMNAARSHKNALCLLTISDHIFKDNESLTAKERQESLGQMIKLSLELA